MIAQMPGSEASPVDIAYLVTGVFFIVGMKAMSSPATARLGNRLAAIGMLIAVVATLLDRNIVSYPWIIAGVVIGAPIGFVSARRVKMTAMPQMVALFNGAGGGAAALVARAEFMERFLLPRLGGPPHLHPNVLPPDITITSALSVVIGAVSFSGSIIAFLKLQELMTGRPITYVGQQFVNGFIVLVIAAGAFAVVSGFGAAHQVAVSYFVIVGAAVLLGV